MSELKIAMIAIILFFPIVANTEVSNTEKEGASASQLEIENLDSRYSNIVNSLVRNKAKMGEYQVLAQKIGFELDRQYTYTEYDKIMQQYKLGVAGKYDFLLLSTGGSEWDYEAVLRFNRQQCGWKMTYYENHDLTVIDEYCKSQDRRNTYVRILKVSKGKNLNLNIEK